MSKQAKHIAMWSGPRNISTALMRAWENRADTVVWDEPFYAHYLHFSGSPHPGADEIIASYETDWVKVVEAVTGAIPHGKSIYYQKHMTHHMLEHIELDWLSKLTNCFLIREPREMITSYIRVRGDANVYDTGYPQQLRIFKHVCALRQAQGAAIPPVIDSRDVLQNPRRMLSLLCEAIGVEFSEKMLSWPAGKRASDGVWSKYWYDSVEKSTGFAPYKPKSDPVPDHLQELLAQCNDIYQELYPHRLGQ
ncbi:MAG: HAD family hydrolase [Ardenticatenaceae bacterium]